MNTFFKALFNVIKGLLKLFLALGLLYGLLYAYGFALFAIDLAERRLSTEWFLHLVVDDHKCVESARLVDPTSSNQEGIRHCNLTPPYPGARLSTSEIFRITQGFFFELPKLTVEYKEEGHNMVTIDIDFNDCLKKSPNYWHELWNIKDDADITIEASNPNQIKIYKERRAYDAFNIRRIDKTLFCENSLKIH